MSSSENAFKWELSRILSKEAANPIVITPWTSLVGIDSLAVVEIINEVEDRYKVSLDFDTIKKLGTVMDLETLITNQQAVLK